MKPGEIIIPQTLKRGDSIAVVSPASAIDPALVNGAVSTLQSWGFIPLVAPHALGSHGSFSATARERLDDLSAVVTDPTVRAILCSRGGYGAVHLLEDLDKIIGPADPKWLIGFSDISALHALWYRHHTASIHGSMARQLAYGPDSDYTRRLFSILTTGHMPPLEWENPTGIPCRDATVTATVSGGNLAVLDALIGTPFNMLEPGNILFIEDIAEPIYKIERMLYHMKLAGILPRLAALVVGRFTEYKPDKNHSSMEQMIAGMVSQYGYPVVFDAPIGHIGAGNMPVLNGSMVTLTVRDNHCVLQ